MTLVPGITDQFGRRFSTLRVSLTNICNLSCTYCVSDVKGEKVNDNGKILSAEEISELIHALNQVNPLQIVRLTGGEPLLFKGIENLISKLSREKIKVRLTTNGVYLAEKIYDLKEAGLDSINVSLDSLEEENFRKITRRNDLKKVLKGISSAIEAGIPVKINAVIMKGVNEHEIIPLLQFAYDNGAVLRFLEVMPMGHLHKGFDQLYFSEREILDEVEKINCVHPLERVAGATARYFIGKQTGTFGIISNISHPFCSDCNRLRLDSYGNIFGCLSSNNGFNIRQSANDPDQLKELLTKALLEKKSMFTGSELSMKAIGG